MLTMPCGSRAKASATASRRSTGTANRARYDVATEAVLTPARDAGGQPRKTR
jgi:hypothetical protein